MPVELGGANFSQGEKQLISLAKALLRRSAIIILDKSTCSIDTETEAKIRQVLREELEGRLLISSQFTMVLLTWLALIAIAVVHQLRHVMDYDKVIILDKGSVCLLPIYCVRDFNEHATRSQSLTPLGIL
jgi:ABC-type multidrug transport system fused ATPase/permease subunit